MGSSTFREFLNIYYGARHKLQTSAVKTAIGHRYISLLFRRTQFYMLIPHKIGKKIRDPVENEVMPIGAGLQIMMLSHSSP